MLRKFTSMGYIVAGFGRRKEKIELLRKELNISGDNEILIESIDITKEEDVINWTKKIINKYGIPYIIIHNAGSVIGCNKDTWDIDMKDLMTSYQIHIAGSVLLIKCFVKFMKDLNRGMIINISSWAGQNGFATGTPYCSSKFAIEGLTQCLAKELEDAQIDNQDGNQVLACCLSPGFVNTDMLKGSFAETAAKQKNVENGDEWAQKSCPWILELNSKKDDKGKLLYHGKSIGPPIEKESMKKYCDFFAVYGVQMEYERYIHQPK